MHRVEIRYETKASLGCYVSWPSAAQILAAESYNANVEYCHVELVLRVHPLEERTKFNILKKLLGKLKSPQTLPFTFYYRCWVAKRVPCMRSVDAEDILGGLPSIFCKTGIAR